MSDKEFIEFIKKVEDMEKRVIIIEEKMKNNTNYACIPTPAQKKLSLREFLISKKLTDDVKKTLAIGFYLEHFEGLSSFNSNDLEKAFERSKEKKPLNINDKVNMNIRKGCMDEAAEEKSSRKAWYLTNSGEQFVKNNFTNLK